MQWGKKEQYYLWYTAYLPLFLIMIYRFIDSLNLFGKNQIVIRILDILTKVGLDFVVFTIIIIFSLIMYKLVIRWFFKDLEGQLENKTKGSVYSIRKLKRLSVNDYTFFLMSLLLPLFSLDYESFINLAGSCLFIAVIIIIFVKTEFISVCPLFFITGYEVYEAIISQSSKEDEQNDKSLRIKAIILTKEKFPDLDDKYRAVRLINNIYLIRKEEQLER
ncbi:hypothetical protein AB7C35_15420 [Bacillus subtilis]|uniref:hypothetical protein n=1 Tax=Bacillus subtilis TaxID=1423 RepID=UPI003513C3A7